MDLFLLFVFVFGHLLGKANICDVFLCFCYFPTTVSLVSCGT